MASKRIPFNSNIPRGSLATIVQTGLCRTAVRHRPAPSLFTFPGLTSRPVWKNSEVPLDKITEALQSSHEALLREYKALRVSQKSSDYKIVKNEETLHHGHWDWNSYILKGVRQTDFAIQCPRTSEILESSQYPRLMTDVPFSYAFFSTLLPNSEIKPHFGPCNLRIRCHYPLVIPNGDLGMRIAGNEVKWETGVPLFFDDTYEHEVWNRTNEDRVVLLFDIWHPDLFDDEIEAIVDMFDYAAKQGWSKKP